MPTGALLLTPTQLRYSTNFLLQDASDSVAQALTHWQQAGPKLRVVCRWQDGDDTRYYLFDATTWITDLLTTPVAARDSTTLAQCLLLGLRVAAPVIGLDGTSVPGAMVLQHGQLLGVVHQLNARIDDGIDDQPASSRASQQQWQRAEPPDAEPLEGAHAEMRGTAGAHTYDVRGDTVDGSIAGAAPPSPRFFNARAPDRVPLNAATYVVVQVATDAAQPGAGMVVEHGDIGDFVGTLTVDIHAPGLRALDATSQTLEVPTTGNSKSLRFGFLAQQAGLQRIDVMAWNGSAQVAGLTLQMAVATEAPVPGAGSATGDMDMRAPNEGEYTLDVSLEPDGCYRFRLSSDSLDEVWKPMLSSPLIGGAQTQHQQALAALNTQARNLHQLDANTQARWLRGMGTLMFENLVPDTLKTVLLQRRDQIRVLNILSDDDATPWELLFVADPDTGVGRFLAESTTVARRRYGTPPSRAFKSSAKAFVLPAGAPAAALAEQHKLASLLGGVTTIDSIKALSDLMDAGDFDLLHFAAHNVHLPDEFAGSYVPFGKERWTLPILAAVPRNKFKARAPLVFMNACTSAGSMALYTQLTGWADRFLWCGSGAFVGTLWEVRDSSARQFAEVFYGSLRSGVTLGEAMQAARKALRDANPGDPTALAYTLYGNPLARLEA
jgi:hypothetical protein